MFIEFEKAEKLRKHLKKERQERYKILSINKNHEDRELTKIILGDVTQFFQSKPPKKEKYKKKKINIMNFNSSEFS